MGLTTAEPDQVPGERSRRDVMIVQDAVVERLAVEDGALDVSRAAAEATLLAA